VTPAPRRTSPEPPAIVDDTLPPCKRMVPVPNSGALGGALGSAMPGDCLIAANGDYGAITIGAKGTAAAPIVLRAATRGMAVFTGPVSLTGAEYVVIDGFNHTGAAGVTIANANNNRITRSRFRLAAARSSASTAPATPTASTTTSSAR
jgi:hypothetical protein